MADEAAGGGRGGFVPERVKRRERDPEAPPPPSVPRTLLLIAGLLLTDAMYGTLAGNPLNPTYLTLYLIGALVLGLILALLIPRLSLRPLDLVVLLWIVLLVVGYASSMLEGYFFTTVFPSVGRFLTALLVVAGFAFVKSGIAVATVRPRDETGPLLPRIAQYLALRRAPSWAGRLVLGTLAYLPIYFAFGALVGPLVVEYYTADVGLTIPDLSVILLLEVARGALYVAILFPLVAILRGDRWPSFLTLAALLYLPGAILPLLLQAPTLPARILPLHALELLGDSLVYALVLTVLLARPRRATVAPRGISASGGGGPGTRMEAEG